MSSFCICKSYSHFFQQNIRIYAIFNDQSFNDMLTNDIISFEQLGPELSVFASLPLCWYGTLWYIWYILFMGTGYTLYIFIRETNFVTSCLFFCKMNPFWKGSTLKGENLLPTGKGEKTSLIELLFWKVYRFPWKLQKYMYVILFSVCISNVDNLCLSEIIKKVFQTFSLFYNFQMAE